jgi:hypothetical protein
VITLFLFEPELVGTSFIVRVTDDNAGDSHTPIFLWGELVPDLAQDVDAREEVEDTVTTLELERFVVNGGITVH